MSLAWKLGLLVGVAWAALMPPLFTQGACTAEFDAENARLEKDGDRLKSSTLADAYWRSRGVPHVVMSPDECRHRKPRNLDRCENGPLVIAKVPVGNLICRVYRDDEIAVWLQYDARDRLEREQVDMSPYKSLPVLGWKIDWAR